MQTSGGWVYLARISSVIAFHLLAGCLIFDKECTLLPLYTYIHAHQYYQYLITSCIMMKHVLIIFFV